MATRRVFAGLRRAAVRSVLALAALFGFVSAPTTAQVDPGPLVLAIQPVLSESATRAAFQPLADYLSKVTGARCSILTSPNFFAYWDTIRKGAGYSLAFDAAHFTDYRVRKFGFIVLVRLPGSISYSLVVPAQAPIVDPSELVAKRIATLGVPSIDATRLNAMFPNPSRQPIIVEVRHSSQVLDMLLQGKVAAAMLPTPIVGQAIARGARLTVVAVTEPIPNIALSAAPSVDSATRNAIRQALLNADRTDAGRKMLQAIGIERFDPATAAVYRGQSRVLKGYWGY